MSSKSLCDKTRLRGDLGLRCQGQRNGCVCVRFYAISDPSSHHAFPPFALSLRFPHSSVSGVATLSEGTVSWASR